MPGYQPVRIVQPTSYFPQNEPIYGHVKSKKKSKGAHPLFEDLKARNMREKMDYQSYLKNKEIVRNDNIPNFNSLKLLGSCNDISYLDTFMSMPRQRHHSVIHESEANKVRSLAKSSSTIFGKGDKKTSIPSDSAAVTAAMLSSLRNASSDDTLYESVEMIHYLKTMQSLNRQKKTRSVQKTGHPLFDHLREEQAMREPCRKTATTKKPFDEQCLQRLRNEYGTSDGNSPSHSSSSSGDEYEAYSRPAPKTSKVSFHNGIQPATQRRHSEQMHHFHKRQDKQKLPRKKISEGNGSESDDERKIIPRPRFVGKGMPAQQPQVQKHRRRSNVSTPSDESDSSFNSGVLR